MKNFWAIAVGINQYQHFQPLGYAQHDASMVHHFLVEEVGIPADHCILLTEVSPTINPHAVYPSGTTIRQAIAQLCQQRIQPGDIVWVFFSGYGVCMQGQDYLMPIDGDPKQPATTAIAIDSLMTALRSAPSKNIILALDINRSQSVTEGQRVGVQIADLAERYGISTILSCQHDQFSHETLALRHGFFTAVLLEGLRYEKCVTLDALIQYLEQRLPELAEHHWRPHQKPLAILSVDQRYELILPKEAALMGVPVRPAPSLPPLGDAYDTKNGWNEPSAPSSTTAPILSSSSSATVPTPPSPSSASASTSNDSFWRQLLGWGSFVVVALLAGVVLVNRDALVGPTDSSGVSGSPSEELVTGSGDGATDSDAPTLETVNQAMLDEAIASLLMTRAASPVNQATDFRRAINLAQRIPPGEPFYDQAQEFTQRWSRVIYDFALARAAQGNYRAAIATSQLVPIDQAEIQEIIVGNLAEWQQGAANQDLLDQAKALTRSQQASSYNEAIGIARRIPEGQPLYGQAQTLIGQWGQDIFTVSRARASQGNLSAAIEAARLVPSGTPAYDEAQAAIAQWQQQL
ncbi:MAG: hypothetical protein EA367_03635 [Leptolyngbya sp. DLM2.Bin15]|nr:MAG: hypothetical protein EA367_03635 [Leptolyngbya sp. DLM2.Bin15]